jgi:hypothetical protein
MAVSTGVPFTFTCPPTPLPFTRAFTSNGVTTTEPFTLSVFADADETKAVVATLVELSPAVGVVAVAAPILGVTNVGDVAKTTAPDPVVPLAKSAADGVDQAGAPVPVNVW